MYKFILTFYFLLINFSVFPQQIALTLKTLQGDIFQYVDKNVIELSYVKTAITGIEGLEQLASLKSITFDKTPFIKDYSFLKNAPGLTKLVLMYGPNTEDWSFIKYLKNLEILYIDGYQSKTLYLDLINNKYIEYLAICNGSLEIFPVLSNVSKSLHYLNLIGNKIRYLPDSFENYSNIKIFLKLNPIDEEIEYDNIILDWAENVLDEKYIVSY
jgi:Leucine-rich repeat (LRR) protein